MREESGEEGPAVPASENGGFVELIVPDIPAAEAETVRAALQRWGLLQRRVMVLRPTLQEEDRLMNEILDRGLVSEDRRRLRMLASGGTKESEQEASQLANALGPDREKLQDILRRNQRALLELSTNVEPEHKKELLDEMEVVIGDLKKSQEAVHSELLGVKRRQDMEAVRKIGRSLNELKALSRRLEGERKSLTKNTDLAALLVTVCRRVLPVRNIDPDNLKDIKPSYAGYLQILDFYFFSDAGRFCFGEHFSGPNWFTRLKRNIAIFKVEDDQGRVVYNAFAVSGEHKTPGASLASPDGPLRAIEAPDEHGRVFDRIHDAEFKLLTAFVQGVDAAEAAAAGTSAASGAQGALGSGARASLWSKKPLCLSCAGAVGQMQQRFPAMTLEVKIGDPDALPRAPKVPSPSGAPANSRPRRPPAREPPREGASSGDCRPGGASAPEQPGKFGGSSSSCEAAAGGGEGAGAGGCCGGGAR